jgi:hypothetical protein
MMDAGLPEFLAQLPLFMIVMFCGAGITLVVAVALILNARRQKAQRVEVRAQPVNTMPMPPLMAFDAGDMPDLDTLLNSPPPLARTARPGVQPVTLSDGERVEAIDLLTVMRDVTGGGLIVQINDKTYRVAGNMSDAEFRNKLKSLMKEIATSLGGSAPLPSTPPTSAPRPASPAVPLPSSAAFDLPKFTLDSSTSPLTRKDLKEAIKAPIPQIDIAGAIEAYLQHKRATTGQFADRQLHVRPAPDGGIRIQVDQEFFEAVDEVSEPDVRAFLKATIAEWQERQ